MDFHIIDTMRKAYKIALIVFISAILFSAVSVLAINLHMLNYTNEYIVNDVSEIDSIEGLPGEVVIVLGAYVYQNGQPCPILVDRLETGIAAYEKAYTNRILLTGDHGTKGYDEVNAMKTYVFDRGIPQSDVFLDHAGFSTYDSVTRAKEIFLIDEALISTQEYHLTRAVYIARKSGINAYGVAADLRRYPRSEMSWYLFREWMARVKDFFFVNVFKPGPVYLGDEIPISGDSLPSYDKPEDLE